MENRPAQGSPGITRGIVQIQLLGIESGECLWLMGRSRRSE